MKKRSIAIGLMLMASLTACGGKGDTVINNTEAPNVTSEATEAVSADKKENKIKKVNYSLGALKEKYDYDDSNYISPIYNVEQQTLFDFKFKSKVDPSKAITVHTDPSCNVESTVFQYNWGFITEDGGREIVVAPYSPVLNTEKDVKITETWGNAPIYYLCIRYDMDSEDVKELSEPIVVPFTIKRDVNMPQLRACISKDGIFSVKWNPVKGAKEYKVYKSYMVRDEDAKKLTRQQCGYMGDHLDLVTTTTDCEYIPNDFDSDVSYNNFNDQSIFVVAVDENGNESGVSIPISTWVYSDKIPHSMDKLIFSSDLENFIPSNADVKMNDGSVRQYAINWYRDDTGYKYEIPGTSLTGHVETSKDYGEQVINKEDIFNSLLEVENAIPVVPDNTVKTNTEHILNHTFKKENMLQMNDDAMMTRLDIEMARMINDGVYTADIDDIEYYSKDELNREWDGKYRNDSGNLESVASSENQSTVETEISTEENKNSSIDETLESEYISETDEEINKTEETEETVETESESSEETASDREDDIDDSTVEVYGSDYLVVADSAAEEYLALNFINSNEEIDLTVMPELMNYGELGDMFAKVMRQNPYENYICDFDISDDGTKLLVTYAEDKDTWERKKKEIQDKAKEIDSEIIKDGMTDEEKIGAIWDYIVGRGSYNQAAIEAAQYTYDVKGDLADNWTPYGTLMNDTAVCEGKAKAFIVLAKEAGIDDVIEVSGSAGGPHAWNAVKLGDTWCYIDTTAGDYGPIEKYVYLTSAEYLGSLQGYTFDDYFCLDKDFDKYVYDSTDLQYDWYKQNNKLCASRKDMEKSIKEQIEAGNNCAVVKVAGEVNDDVMLETIKNLYDEGVITDDFMQNINVGNYMNGYVVLGYYDKLNE